MLLADLRCSSLLGGCELVQNIQKPWGAGRGGVSGKGMFRNTCTSCGIYVLGCWEYMSLLHFACYSPMELRGWRSLFFFFISVSLVTHIGRCDRSHPRANLIVHASQIQSGEGVSKDRECLILLPPTDLFPENPGIKWEASCGRVCRDISCLNRWPWGQGQEQAEVIGFPLQCSMKAAW